MVKKLYLDGCSFTYGLHLDPADTLEALFVRDGGYIVTNQSRPGKSNLAIAMDAYRHCDSHDTVVLGFTYSARFYLKYQDTDIDFLPSKFNLETDDAVNGDQLSQAYTQFHKYFYTMYEPPFCDTMSDMLVDSVCSHILARGKKLVCFSWEKRNTINTVIYPYIGPEHRLPDRHLNPKGTQYLFDLLQREINE